MIIAVSRDDFFRLALESELQSVQCDLERFKLSAQDAEAENSKLRAKVEKQEKQISKVI